MVVKVGVSYALSSLLEMLVNVIQDSAGVIHSCSMPCRLRNTREPSADFDSIMISYHSVYPGHDILNVKTPFRLKHGKLSDELDVVCSLMDIDMGTETCTIGVYVTIDAPPAPGLDPPLSPSSEMASPHVIAKDMVWWPSPTLVHT